MFARIMGLALLVGCGLAFVGQRGTGADEKPAPRKIVVGVDKSAMIEMSTKDQITILRVVDPDILQVGQETSPPRYFVFRDGKLGEPDPEVKPKTAVVIVMRSTPFVIGPRSSVITGRNPGKTKVMMTDVKGNSETINVEVRRELALPSGITYDFPNPTSKPIEKVAVDDAKIIKAMRRDKGESVQIESLAIGETALRLTDADGKSEAVVVQIRKPTLMLTQGEQKKIQLMKKAVLSKIANDNEQVLKVQPVETTTVEIQAIEPGISNLVLIGTDDTQERFEVGVKPKAK